jgi:SAM-dependent methyltransferase
MDIDWLEQWRELVANTVHTTGNESMKRYRTHARRKQERHDPLLDFVLDSVDGSTTVLEIGAGNGRWTIPLAGKAGAVTAIEPDSEMLAVLRENIAESGADIRIIEMPWEEVNVEPHDIVVCAHSMYTTPEIAPFVRRMEAHAKKTCYMAVRMPPVNGIIGELTHKIHGRLHDSVNAVVAFNALYYMGICANVLVEEGIYHWSNDSFEEAFLRAKRHLSLVSSDEYDGLIDETLRERLTYSEGRYTWPDGMRSALLWRNPSDNR